jgi:DNA-binding response OmpR family regulator
MKEETVGINVLIVEDEIVMQEFLKALLAPKGFNLYTAFTVSEAQVLINSLAFALAIVDYNIGDGFGTEIVSLIKSKTPSTKVLGISAKDSAEKFYSAGADYFLQKPFNVSTFLQTLDDILK